VLNAPEGAGSDHLKVAQMENSYKDIYELMRHALHITETIRVMSKALKAAHEESQDLFSSWNNHFVGHTLNPVVASQSLRTLKNSALLASSLHERADSFVDRLRNEAKIV